MKRIFGKLIFWDKKAACSILLLLIMAMVFSTVSCDNGKVRQKDFNGTWAQGRWTYTISNKEITFDFNDGGVAPWTITIDSVTPMENTDANTRANYPSGFRFDGHYTSPGYSGNKSETFFMHTSKKEFLDSRRQTYVKQ